MILHPNQSHADTQAENTVLIHGDSLSAAYGMELEKGWVALLQKRHPEWEIVNASISGETTSGGKQRLPKLLETHRPDVLVLELGANDALRGQNLKATAQNLKAMVHACQSARFECRVVLLGIRLPTNYGPAYDRYLQKVYQDLAESEKLIFDPFFMEEVALDPALMQEDGLHPNAQAQPYLEKRVRPLIEKALEAKEATSEADRIKASAGE